MSLSKIPFELLKGRENFDAWEVGAQAYLTIKDLWDWTKKAPNAEKPAEITSDAKAKGELTLLLDPSLYSYVAKSATTKDAWASIVGAFQDSGTSLNIFTLQKFVTSKTDDFKSMEEYVNEMLKMWRKVQTAGYNIDENTAGSLMLAGLPVEYRPMILGIKNSGKNITVDYVKTLLLQDVYFDRERNDESALAVKSKKFFKKKSKDVKCFNCGGNHFKNKCPELKGKYNKNEKEKVLFSAFIANEKSDTWYIDSGATAHMTHQQNAVERLVKSKKDHVTAANGDSMKIIGMGDVKKCVDGIDDLVIKNVQVIPKICANLLSVSQLVLNGNEVIFNKHGCKITDKKGDLVATGRLEDNMFKLNTVAEFACSAKSDNIQLWHRRLGHISLNNMKYLNVNVPSGLKCKICIKGKQSRYPFAHEGTRATEKIEIVHSDVFGPLKAKSIGGCKWFVTFIDDYTRKVFVYPMKKKSEVFKKFVDFKNFAERQSECKLKILRSDNGTEYINKNFELLCSKIGILHQKSVPYTPQQNGLAERMNRTLLDRVRCMLIDSGLSRGFWAEALCTAARIINSVPCKGTKDKSPDELWAGKIPDFNVLKVFGCTAFAHVPKQKRGKLDDKSKECTFVGYSEESKAYRLYCRASKKIIISRDVNFIENEFENHIESEDDNSLYIDLQEICEPGEDAEDSHISNDMLDQEEQNQHEHSVDESFHSSGSGQNDVNEDTIVSNDQIVDDSTICDVTLDDVNGDPTYTTRVRIEPTAEKPSTRSTNPLNLLNASFAFCTQTPMTPKEALESDESNQWLEAMQSELKSLVDNNTWEVVELPNDRKAIKNKWVFAKKLNAAGSTVKFKARLCAKGFSQREGIDYTETFAPVARYTSLRYILAVAAEMDLNLTQMDAVSAFLNGPLKEDVYMEQPPNFNDGTNRVCKLKKSIYGLKQSGRNWNQLLNKTLTNFGLTRTVSDQCVYVSRKSGSFMIVMIWVDDVLIACDKKSEENRLREALEGSFKMKYLGDANVILGIRITRDRAKRTISIDQRHYIELILKRFGMEECNAIGTPLDVNTKYSREMESSENQMSIPYREAIGSLLFAAQVTRPDINFSVILLSRYCEKPKQAHWLAAKRIMRYLKGTIDRKLIFGITRSEIIGYCDSDFAADIDDRKSTSGYVFVKNGAALSWQTKKQPVVALSTAEAEFNALAFASKEALWLQSLEYEILGKSDDALQMYCDNKGAVDLAINNNCSEKTKHIDIKLKFVHSKIVEKNLSLDHISTENMLADVLTKSLTKEKHQHCITAFGLK